MSVRLPPTFSTFSQARASIRMAQQLDPDGSWCAVSGGRKVVGLAVSFRRGDYVSIGPVAVHPIAQRRGVGRALMRAVVDACSDAACLSLVHSGANPQAFTLYRSLGFRSVYAEASFSGPCPSPPPGPGDVRRARPDEIARVVALDAELTCVDRSAELELLGGLGRFLVTDDGYLGAVVLGDSLAIGPGAAGSADAMRALVAAALQELPPGGVVCRAPANSAAVDVLLDAGLTAESVGVLMARGSWPPRRGEHVHPVFPEVL